MRMTCKHHELMEQNCDRLARRTQLSSISVQQAAPIHPFAAPTVG